MNINFETLKVGFQAYLQKILQETGQADNLDLANLSIFNYGEELESYITDELKLNLNESNTDISDLLAMEFENGIFSNNNEADENNDLLVGLINEYLQDSDVIKSIDNDKNGSLSKDEATQLLEFLNTGDKDIKNLSLNEILSGMEKVKEGEYDADLSELEEVEESEETSEPEASSGPSSSGTDSGNYNPSNQNPTNNADQNQTPKTYQDMTIEELEAEKNTKQTELNTATQDVQAVYSGTNENVKAAEENQKTAEEAYTKAVQEDEKLTAEQKEKQAENLKQINEQETKVDNIKCQIVDKENQVISKKADVDSINSNITALQSSLSTLQGQKSEDPEQQAAIDAQAQSVSAQLEAARAQLKTEEANLKQLEGEQKTLETNLATEEGILTTLETERQTIEQEILTNCSEATKLAMTEFNTAKTEATNVKATELSKAQTALETKRTELSSINSILDTKKAEKTEKDNKVPTNKLFDSDLDIETKYIDDGTMPYLLIGPKNANPNEELPLLVYLHGGGEVGEGESALRRVGPGKIIPEWNLQNFNGYIICPILSKGGWNNETAETSVRNIVKNFSQSHAVDEDKIAVAGHSMGGQGALYMAQHASDIFKKAAVLSGFETSRVNINNIDIPIMGYTGSYEKSRQEFMIKDFARRFGSDSLITVTTGHAGVPKHVLLRDMNGNGCSDVLEWLFDEEFEGKPK